MTWLPARRLHLFHFLNPVFCLTLSISVVVFFLVGELFFKGWSQISGRFDSVSTRMTVLTSPDLEWEILSSAFRVHPGPETEAFKKDWKSVAPAFSTGNLWSTVLVPAALLPPPVCLLH